MPRFALMPVFDEEGNSINAGPEPTIPDMKYLHRLIQEIGFFPPGPLGYGSPNDAKRVQDFLRRRGASTALLNLLEQAA